MISASRRSTIATVVAAGCVSLWAASAPAKADPKPADLLKSTTVTAYSPLFYGPADPAALKRCLDLTADLATQILPEYRTCRGASYVIGPRLVLSAFEVRVSARNRGWVGEEMREIALVSAAKAAKDAGRRFLTRTEQHEYVTCSGTPVARTTATASGNSIYGTTTFTTDARCSTLYVTSFLAFDDYEAIRGGVLSRVKDGKGTLDPDLYYDIADRVAHTRSNDPGLIENFRSHPLEPWKRYLPVDETYAAVVEKYRLRQPLKVVIKAPEPRPLREQSIEGRLAIKGGASER